MTLSITAVADYATGVPRVVLTVASTASEPNAVPNNSSLTLTRVHGDGSEHRVLTSADPRSVSGSWVGWDYHAPFNQSITYRVDAAASSTPSPAAYVLSDETWLIHASDPTLSVCVDKVAEIKARSLKSLAGRFAPPGENPIYISDGSRGGLVGSVVIRHSDEAAVRALLEDDQVVLINTPADLGWRISWMWVQPGQVDFDNPGGTIFYLKELITIPWEEAQQPDVDVTNLWTAGAAAAYFTANGINAGAVSALYADALALKTNTPL